MPVVLEIAERARELAADDAWIVDFTNPVGIVTRALLDAGHRAVGLCNVAINFQRQIAARLGVAPGQVLVDQVGLNHLTWIRAVWVDGRDVLADVLAEFGDELAHEIGLPRALLERLGAIPSYYLRYFYAEREVVEEQRAGHAARTDRGRDREGAARAVLRPDADREAVPARPARRCLLQRGRDAARRLARHRLPATRRSSTSATAKRSRAWPTTTSSRCRPGSGATGPRPCHNDRWPPSCSGSSSTSRPTSGLAAEAAITRDRDTARLALMTNPLVREYQLSDQLLDRLLAADENPVSGVRS